MADLTAIGRELAAERHNSEDAARALFVEQERLRRLERQARELERRADERNPVSRKEREDLTRAISESRTRATRLRTAKDSAVAALAALNDRLQPLTDPRRAIGALRASHPIVMFPVRLETRFVSSGGPGAAQKQLLVRVYPDDCLVDSFEPDLSESEVTNLRRYWCELFSAGRDDTRERAAWRNLCAAHGAGRAMYLISRYAPLAGSDAVPTRTGTSDIILCIPVGAPIVNPELKAAVGHYWTSTWRAGHDQAAFGELRQTVGADRAEEVRSSIVPFNIQEKPQAGAARATVPVSAVFVVLTPIEQAAVKRQAWTRAPSVRLLPERFVLIADSGAEHIEQLGEMIPQPLAVGPDPLAEGGDQFQQSGADLHVPESLKWITDFDTALEAGMAFRVDLTPRQAQQGFDRLYVVGLRLTSDEETGRKELEELLQHHLQSQSGFAILPQGTPTNNTEAGSSGWSRADEADALFDQVRAVQGGDQLFDPAVTDPYERKDGLVLAEALGIDAAVLQRVPAAGATDQAEGRAMNAALWPATLGYWMDTEMRPVFAEEAIERTRQHFIKHVSGRGAVPALRIGNQPYGVLPTTAFSRLDWLDQRTGRSLADVRFLRMLRDVLRRLDEMFWSRFAASVPRLGQAGGDPQQRLLDIVGLHPSSVDFHLQVVDSADRIWNESKFRFRGRGTLEAAMRAQMRAGSDLLRSFGYTGTSPEIIEKFVSTVHGPMTRPVIDRAPLSELNELPVCTDDDRNYVGWCANKAEQAFDDLRQQVGFSEGKLPDALFYHVLRHALQLGYYDAAVNLHVTNGLIAADQVAQVYREPSFVHIADTPVSESRYRLLYAKSAAITGDAGRTVAEFIPSWTQSPTGRASVLADQLDALHVLEHIPTARLERAFAEHVDLCTYRWDAWMLSLVNERLADMRRPDGPETSSRLGVYLGAFGWLEDVRPDEAALVPVALSGEVRDVFDTPGQPPLQRDPSNGGHVLAPSLNHAVTAAVLRNGYLNNATPSNPALFAVDLSSARVRVALQFVEGIRNGQSLGALLGYQFERRLHDRHDEAETDAFIYQVRKAFPLAAKRIADSVEGEAMDAPIESLEARNVCDGLLLLEHVRTSGIKTYPWGKDLDRGTAAQEAVINEEVLALFDIQDAIADVALSESVHQVLMGNSDRAAAVMDAYAKSTFPPEPDVVRTPRSGTTLTHRVALHLPVDAAAVAGPAATPRAQSEPAIDRWLADVLPPIGDLVVRVRFANTGTATAQVLDVSMESLGLRPIDLLYLLDPDQEQAMNDLDDRIVHHVITTAALSPDASVQIRYTELVPERKTAFETAPLIASLRGLLLNGRPLKPSDAALESEGSDAADAALAVPMTHVDAARSNIDQLRQDVVMLTTTIAPLDDPATSFGVIVDRVDASLASFNALQRRAGLCGVALSGSGHTIQTVRGWFTLIRSKAHDVGVFWNSKLEGCNSAIAEASDPALPESLKVDALARAERVVSTDYTMPLPATSASMLPTVIAKRNALLAVKGQIEAVEGSTAVAIKPLWTAWSATFVPRARHDVTLVDFSVEEQQLRLLVSDMHRQLTGLERELEARLTKADDLIANAATVVGKQRADRLIEAVAALLGDGFRVIPRFTLSANQADEWQNAYDNRTSLVAHAATLHDFPVDDWIHGLARVRGRMHDLEKVMQITAAFERTEPALEPIQLPFRPGEPWLALDVPGSFNVSASGEHLLYSAIYTSGGFDKLASAQGGVLLDEWTETIPGTQETAGLAFHYDRPSSEPPHALLLITPASTSEQWQWPDVALAIPETFALARKRAAEPRDVSGTPLSRFLPATLMAFTTGGISISSQFQAADVMFASSSPDA